MDKTKLMNTFSSCFATTFLKKYILIEKRPKCIKEMPSSSKAADPKTNFTIALTIENFRGSLDPYFRVCIRIFKVW